MTTINLNNRPTVIDQTLSQQVMAKISGYILPIEVITSFIRLKPKHMAKCCLISKDIRTLITEENDTNRRYWNDHVIRRWGAKVVEEKPPSLTWCMGMELSDIIPPVRVPKKIKEYSRKYLTEKRALKYFSLVEKHNPFSIAHAEIDAADHAIMTIKHVLPYLKGESPKAEFFYLAGINITVALYTSSYDQFLLALHPLGIDPNFRQCVLWLEKAAEKGHLESAYQLAYHLIDRLPGNKSHLQDDATRAIKWLRIASDRGYTQARSLLQAIEKEDWEEVAEGMCDDQIKAELIGLIRKRSLEEIEGAGPPTKKQKR